MPFRTPLNLHWARYPLDLGHNFVLAHGRCNGRKSDRLAAVRHLERWAMRNGEHGDQLAAELGKKKLLSDLPGTNRIAAWAYSQAESAGALTWVTDDEMEPLGGAWVQMLSLPP